MPVISTQTGPWITTLLTLLKRDDLPSFGEKLRIDNIIPAGLSFSMIVKVLRTVKTTEDGSPEDATESVYLLCDLGLALARLLFKDHCKGNEAETGKIPGGCCLPQSFFRAVGHRRTGAFCQLLIERRAANDVRTSQCIPPFASLDVVTGLRLLRLQGAKAEISCKERFLHIS